MSVESLYGKVVGEGWRESEGNAHGYGIWKKSGRQVRTTRRGEDCARMPERVHSTAESRNPVLSQYFILQ